MTAKALDEHFLRAGNIRAMGKRYSACVKAADEKGITLFGMDDKRCWTSDNPEHSYKKFGKSGQCKKGKGSLSTGLTKSSTVFVYQKSDQGK